MQLEKAVYRLPYLVNVVSLANQLYFECCFTQLSPFRFCCGVATALCCAPGGDLRRFTFNS
jgi:hypothetical protein